jgi:hypothetical protein
LRRSGQHSFIFKRYRFNSRHEKIIYRVRCFVVFFNIFPESLYSKCNTHFSVPMSYIYFLLPFKIPSFYLSFLFPINRCSLLQQVWKARGSKLGNTSLTGHSYLFAVLHDSYSNTFFFWRSGELAPTYPRSDRRKAYRYSCILPEILADFNQK